jgi:hypothetical protein
MSGAFRRRTKSSVLRVWDCLACIPDTYAVAFEAADETLWRLNPRRSMTSLLRFEQICANEAISPQKLGWSSGLVRRRTFALRLQSQIGCELSAPQPRAFSNDAAKHAAEMRLVTQSTL